MISKVENSCPRGLQIFFKRGYPIIDIETIVTFRSGTSKEKLGIKYKSADIY